MNYSISPRIGLYSFLSDEMANAGSSTIYSEDFWEELFSFCPWLVMLVSLFSLRHSFHDWR